MVQGKSFVSALMAGAASLALVVGSAAPACAQSASGGYSIASQPLAQALMALSRAANIDIVAPAKLTRGRVAGAVKGADSVEDALRQMLSGTGLTFRAKGRGYVIELPAGSGSSGPARPQASSSPAQSNQGKGSVEGAVTDAATGRRLAGALVKVAGTSQTAVTDEQGQFHLTGVPAGEVQLQISYLGRPDELQPVSVAASETSVVDLVLAADNQIIVYGGTRSARALALNRERTAPNSSTVISSDLLGNFQGTTISEALRRAPGVAFEQDPVTGDGTNIILRGLTSDYNQVTLNGVALPDTSGRGRSANLGNVLADSVSEIKINKTLLPSQDGAGTGGLVEIQTKSPLDRAKRYASFAIEGSKRAKGYSDDFLVAGTLSARFGKSGNFGLSLSAQYREQTLSNYQYSISSGQYMPGPYLPLNSFGRPMQLGDIDPRTPFPFEDASRLYVASVNTGYNEATTKTLGINATAEWQPADSTNLRFDYNRADRTADTLNLNLSVRGSPRYVSLPVPGLAGQTRLVLRDTLTTVFENMTASYSAGEKQITDTFSFRGETEHGPWKFTYRAGYVDGRSSIPSRTQVSFSIPGLSFVDPGMMLPEAVNSATGVTPTIFGERSGRALPLPLFSQAGFARFNNPSVIRFSQANTSLDFTGENTNKSAGADVRYTVGGLIDYIQLGGDYNRAHFGSRTNDVLGYSGVRDADFNTPTAQQFGVQFEDVSFAQSSNSNGTFRLPTPASIRALVKSLPQTEANGLTTSFLTVTSPLNGLSYTNEEAIAGYLETRLQLGKFEAIAGVRVTKVNVDAAIASQASYLSPTGEVDEQLQARTRKIIYKTASQTDWLPRVLLNYRPQDNVVFRAGYYSTVARPQVNLLAGEQTVSYVDLPFFGPNADQPMLEVTTGNPALRPSVTHNFDVGGEYYSKSVGVLKANVFYKRITNLLENTRTQLTDLSGVTLPDDPRFTNLPSNLYILSSKPINNPDVATIWGVELAVERQFDFLPGALSGFGVYANYTYSNSSKNEPRSWYSKPVYDSAGNIVNYVQEDYVLENISFAGSPKHSGTASLTYNKYGFDAALSYTYQARRLSSLGDYNLPTYVEALDTLDFRGEYRFKLAGGNFRIYVEGSNLLKGARDADTESSLGGVGGTPKYYTAGYFRGGRSFTLGLGANF